MIHDASIKLYRLFVYGTLRRGESNHAVWLGRATHVADGYIQGVELVSLGEYCCIVTVDDPARTVVGEIYDVPPDSLGGIEAMETEAGFVRRPVEVHLGSKLEHTPPIRAGAYFYSRPETITGRPRVRSGDWTQRRSSC